MRMPPSPPCQCVNDSPKADAAVQRLAMQFDNAIDILSKSAMQKTKSARGSALMIGGTEHDPKPTRPALRRTQSARGGSLRGNHSEWRTMRMNSCTFPPPSLREETKDDHPKPIVSCDPTVERLAKQIDEAIAILSKSATRKTKSTIGDDLMQGTEKGPTLAGPSMRKAQSARGSLLMSNAGKDQGKTMSKMGDDMMQTTEQGPTLARPSMKKAQSARGSLLMSSTDKDQGMTVSAKGADLTRATEQVLTLVRPTMRKAQSARGNLLTNNVGKDKGKDPTQILADARSSLRKTKSAKGNSLLADLVGNTVNDDEGSSCNEHEITVDDEDNESNEGITLLNNKAIHPNESWEPFGGNTTDSVNTDANGFIINEEGHERNKHEDTLNDESNETNEHAGTFNDTASSPNESREPLEQGVNDQCETREQIPPEATEIPEDTESCSRLSNEEHDEFIRALFDTRDEAISFLCKKMPRYEEGNLTIGEVSHERTMSSVSSISTSEIRQDVISSEGTINYTDLYDKTSLSGSTSGGLLCETASMAEGRQELANITITSMLEDTSSASTRPHSRSKKHRGAKKTPWVGQLRGIDDHAESFGLYEELKDSKGEKPTKPRRHVLSRALSRRRSRRSHRNSIKSESTE